MSWDIVVQDLPSAARSVTDIPEDFVPRPIGARSRIVEVIKFVAPFADVTDSRCICLNAPGVNIEIGIDSADPITAFTFHVSGGDLSAAIVANILDRLGLRALDAMSSSGIFDPAQAAESLRAWQKYRDRVL